MESLSLLVLLVFGCPKLLPGDAPLEKSLSEPEITEVFPLGWQQGESVEVEIRGEQLEGAYAIWFDEEDLTADVENVEPVAQKPDDSSEGIADSREKEKPREQRLQARFDVKPHARPGPRSLRVVTPRGVHWPHCWSMALGGRGIAGGRVVGASDEHGAHVADGMVAIGDVFATVYKAFGIDWTKTYDTPIGRPVKIANSIGDKTGKPICELI